MAWLKELASRPISALLIWLDRRRLPQVEGAIQIAGLHQTVEIIRDRWGIPHIYAESLDDLLFAQGYVHAQDRLWQMDFQRRLASGRLAEILGRVALPLDRWVRTLGLRRAAEQEPALLDREVSEALESYAAGINAYLSHGPLPLEFTLLRYRPEPWTSVDTLVWAKMQAWALSVNWEAELLRAQLIKRLGPEQAAELEACGADDRPYIVPEGTDYNRVGMSALEHALAARRWSGPGPGTGLGSNSWVLAGTRTVSGAPLLANDMHLLLTAPPLWYENHLVCPEFNVIGVTFPGIPLIVAGHNGHVAWGFTNGFPDVQDLYIERVRRTEDGYVQYEYQGHWYDAEVIREEIRVRGSRPVIEEVIITRHGPIINSLAADLAGEQPLALRWTALEPNRMVEALFHMARARNCLEFREALRFWVAPVQNTVYADTAGNIAYSFPGKIPIRARGNGRLPVPGWTGEYEWVGYIPFEELPHLYNPPQGYIASANNRVVDERYPYWLGTDYCTHDRAQRIVELIEAKEKMDVADAQRMQFDQVSPLARSIARSVLDALQGNTDPELMYVLNLLEKWEGDLGAGSTAAAVYEVFIRQISWLVLESKLGELTSRYLGRGPTPVLADVSIFVHRSLEWLEEVLQRGDSHWFDLGCGERRAACVERALRATLAFLKTHLGRRREAWTWGQLHTVTFRHPLAQIWPFRWFCRGPYPVGGDATTLWASGSNQHDLECENVVGPPFRFIADLSDLRRAWGLLAPGQSSHPASPHYDDGVRAWFEAGYHPLLFTREEVEQDAEAHLHLKPMP